MNQPVKPPTAKRGNHRREHHGDVFIDPYEWLRDKDDPEVIAHLEAENAYTEDATAHLEPLRQKIFDEIKARTKETDLSVPMRRAGWWYYARSFEGKQYAVHCRCPIGDPDDWTPPALDEGTEIPGEQVLLDENVEADGHEYFALGAATVSLDSNILAFSVDVKGDERYTLKFKDLRTGELYDDTITGIGAGGTWAADSRTLYYTTVDEAWRPDTVWRHRLASGLPAEKVYHEPDERFWVGIGRSRSDKYLFVASGSAVTTEVRYIDASDPTAEFTTVWERRDLVEYSVEHAVVGGQDRFLILHNDGAENFMLVDAPVSDPSDFRTLIEHRPDVRLDGVDAFDGFLVISYRSEALPKMALWPINADGGYGRREELTFDSELTAAGMGGNPNWSAPKLRIGATSFITPARVYDLDLATGERTLLREQPVLGGYRPEDYVERRDWATAPDGARVPISIIHRAGLQFPAPALLYGYGAYESCEDPRFSIARLSLLDRGMVFVIAHVRGGGELGRPWYEHGKLLEKTNTFTDFIAAARHLIEGGLTRPQNLVALGGSAGGLLMGAVANMAPELFAGILAQVPFVDALTTILDPSLPLTVTEWDEWGNPLDDPEVYRYMKSYTPYENVAAQDYPAILAMTSLNDTRVYYVEPAKWVAALRHTKTDGHPVLLKTEMVAGHGGLSGRYERWKEAAFQYSWLLAAADRDNYGSGQVGSLFGGPDA
ncbi:MULTISPECIES: S9 family peptidase [unclassified Mycolicibacterium]|uniref:S9 family peptidase n=1 Tax=unclassified Mycolicibacterium TaxID=2636767 RepID=UPI0012DCC162|nr:MULTISPECIES: S9 family peptidase [unclassified Mycolicibacterium]MUL83865.1 S9 family peptidase [Mycolicibacterium sp. CBMA 329]MUL90069.1 S9 family peptidase [Mycolicibacterium sp. CBMA 331]MUL97911.1 S9 family peptidase [Mycolicibacterium sp. CBMA 334]MUM28050.1 S9 family peptidase [Mycolicibacterium sp. CBMA 295]MUM39584.1 S9 family peptidase [Mycolicibacterium sp. CBMA 247]